MRPARRRLLGVPYAPRWPIVGSLPFLRSARTDVLLTTAEQLGDIFALDLGTDHVLVVGHPRAAVRVLEERPDIYPDRGGQSGFRRSSIPFLGSGLSTWNEMDTEWRRRRTGIARMFRPRSSFDELQLPRVKTVEHLRSTLEMLIVSDLTRVLLGRRPAEHEAWVVSHGLHSLTDAFWAGKFPGPHPVLGRRLGRAVAVVEAVVQQWVNHALQSGGSPLATHVGGLSSIQVRDELLSQLLSAGTLTVPLLWGLDLFARDPIAQARFRDAIAPDSEDAEYATRALREIFRLCPSTYWIQRRAASDDELLGVAVPCGTRVVIHVPRIHRHPDFWVAPDKFVPERYNDNGWKLAWMPFGRGARACVARSYSLDVAKRTLSNILLHHRVEPVGPPPKLAPGFSLVTRPLPRIKLLPLGDS